MKVDLAAVLVDAGGRPFKDGAGIPDDPDLTVGRKLGAYRGEAAETYARGAITRAHMERGTGRLGDRRFTFTFG